MLPAIGAAKAVAEATPPVESEPEGVEVEDGPELESPVEENPTEGEPAPLEPSSTASSDSALSEADDLLE